MADVLAKLASFAGLPKGWHYGSGGPISTDVLAQAGQAWATMQGLGFATGEVFPGEDGCVLVSGYRMPESLNITINPDRTADLVAEVGNDDVGSVWGIAWDAIPAAAKEVAGFLLAESVPK